MGFNGHPGSRRSNRPCMVVGQQPVASRSFRHASASRGSASSVTLRRNRFRGSVCRLSKLITQSVGTPSSSTVSSSSETRPRTVRGEYGNDERVDSGRHRVAGEYQHRPVATGGVREPDLTASHRPSPASPPPTYVDVAAGMPASGWCERWDSNPHARRHRLLRPTRLPVPPLSHWTRTAVAWPIVPRSFSRV